MKQPKGFPSSDGEQLVCKLKKSIYGLKQASRQWYLKFHNIVFSFGFVENVMDQCIYLKDSRSKVCFLVLYVENILLATNDKSLLHEVKQFLSKNFDMKDMGEASYVIGIKIHRDRFQGILGLSQETYINRSSSYHFEFVFSGPHLYRSVIFRLSLYFQGHTHIDRSFFV